MMRNRMEYLSRWCAAALALAIMLLPMGAAGENESPYTFTDALGREVTVLAPQKVAVGMGSFAEMWTLAGGALAAVTQDALDEGRVEPDDQLVVLGGVKSPSVEKMIELGADFVILSANIAEHVALQDQLRDLGITAAYFDVETFDQYLDVLGIMTRITGRQDLYKINGTDIEARIEEAIALSAGREQPTVLFLRAYSTGVRAKGSDSMTGHMLQDLGCINIADREGALLDDLSLEVILKADPDFIFVTTMGESEEKAMASVEELLVSSPLWSELSAVKAGRYILLPKALFHLKPNARWAESYQMLADVLYGGQS